MTASVLTMDVQEAVRLAKEWVASVYTAESISNLGLEEVEHNRAKGTWFVTVGFSRPWNSLGPISTITGGLGAARSYKVVQIDERTQQVVALKERERTS